MSKKKSSAVSIRGMLLSMFVGGVAGYAMVSLGGRYLPRWFNLSGFGAADVTGLLVSIPVCFFLAVVVHELGHLAGALACGFRFRVLTLGPWSIIAVQGKWQHRFTFSAMGLIAGQQISSPPPTGASNRQFVIYLLGGGLANVGAALLAVVGALALPGPPLLVALLLAFASFNAFLGSLNFFPISTQTGVRTDGYQIRTLLRGGADAVRFRALFGVAADMYAGVRPRDWSPQMISDLALGDTNELEQLLSHLLRLQASLDRGDIESSSGAAAAIEALYGSVPLAMRGQFAAELAFYHGFVEGDAAKARRFADDISDKSYLISPATVHRGRAAALFAEARYQEADDEIRKGLNRVNASTNELDRLMEPEWLRALQAQVALRIGRSIVAQLHSI